MNLTHGIRGLTHAVALACIALMVVTGGAWAATTNSVVTYTDDFETYSAGEYIANAGNGEWNAATNLYMVATNAPVNNATSKAMTNSTHTIVAKLDTEGTEVTNNFDGSSEENVWIDMNIQMVPSDDLPTSITNSPDIQTAIALQTNGQLVAYITQSESDTTNPSNNWVEIGNASVGTSEWHRLTVSLAYVQTFLEYNYFKVDLDGVSVSNSMGWSGITNTLPTAGGVWFECANRDVSADQLQQVLFSGTGYLDDFLVTNAAPSQFSFYTNGVPGWWLASYSLTQDDTESGSLANEDNDVYVAWEEWMLGTHPGVSNTFQLMIESDGGTNYLEWIADGGVDVSVSGEILITKSTNLLDGYTSTNQYPRNTLVAGTNTWSDTAGGDAFYMFSVTTD